MPSVGKEPGATRRTLTPDRVAVSSVLMVSVSTMFKGIRLDVGEKGKRSEP